MSSLSERKVEKYDVSRFQQGCDGPRSAAILVSELAPSSDIEHLRGLFKYMVQTTLNICEIIDNLNLDPRQKAELFNALSSALSGTIQAANELYFPNQQTSRPGSPRDYKTDAEALTKLASLFTEHSPRQS